MIEILKYPEYEIEKWKLNNGGYFPNIPFDFEFELAGRKTFKPIQIIDKDNIISFDKIIDEVSADFKGNLFIFKACFLDSNDGHEKFMRYGDVEIKKAD